MEKLHKKQAFDLAIAGRKVKRDGWPAGQYLYVKDGRFYLHTDSEGEGKDELYKLNDSVAEGKKVKNPDRDATDWKVYEDEIPAPEVATGPGNLKATFVNNKKEQPNK